MTYSLMFVAACLLSVLLLARWFFGLPATRESREMAELRTYLAWKPEEAKKNI